jgi:hypothetical protein
MLSVLQPFLPVYEYLATDQHPPMSFGRRTIPTSSSLKYGKEQTRADIRASLLLSSSYIILTLPTSNVVVALKSI